jgi:integrase
MADKEQKRRKRGQGEGSIYKRKDGRWVAVVNLGYQNGKLTRKSYYGQTRKEASDKLTAALNDIKKGIPIVTERQTVKEFLDRWLNDCVKPSVRLSTFLSYESEVRVHISPKLGHIQLEKLTPQHIQAYMNDRLKSELSATTVAYHRSLLRMALNQALRWNLVGRNVATLVDPPRTEKYEIQPITPEQARSFLEVLNGNRLEALFAVALSLGLRRGEALGLRWSDIDFDARTLRVSQILQRLDHKLCFSEPKTKSSKRVLALPETLVSKLREHRTRQLEEKLAAGEHWQDTGLVFTTSIGTPIDPRNVKRKLDALLKAAELPHYRVHDLRHFCASLLLAQGVPLKVVSDLLGHTRISVTADLYTHVLPSLKREAMDLMDSILTGTR